MGCRIRLPCRGHGFSEESTRTTWSSGSKQISRLYGRLPYRFRHGEGCIYAIVKRTAAPDVHKGGPWAILAKVLTHTRRNCSRQRLPNKRFGCRYPTCVIVPGFFLRYSITASRQVSMLDSAMAVQPGSPAALKETAKLEKARLTNFFRASERTLYLHPGIEHQE